MSRESGKPRFLRRLVVRVALLDLVAAVVYVPFRNHQQRQAVARLEVIRDGLRHHLACSRHRMGRPCNSMGPGAVYMKSEPKKRLDGTTLVVLP